MRLETAVRNYVYTPRSIQTSASRAPLWNSTLARETKFASNFYCFNEINSVTRIPSQRKFASMYIVSCKTSMIGPFRRRLKSWSNVGVSFCYRFKLSCKVKEI